MYCSEKDFTHRNWSTQRCNFSSYPSMQHKKLFWASIFCEWRQTSERITSLKKRQLQAPDPRHWCWSCVTDCAGILWRHHMIYRPEAQGLPELFVFLYSLLGIGETWTATNTIYKFEQWNSSFCRLACSSWKFIQVHAIFHCSLVTWNINTAHFLGNLRNLGGHCQRPQRNKFSFVLLVLTHWKIIHSK